MRVVEAARFGGPEVLVGVQRPDPVPGPGQVVVRVTYADILFLDTMIRRGWGADQWGVQVPYVPGSAVSGTVIGLGERVAESWLGRRVATMTEGWGGYAEQAVALASSLVAIPDGLDDAPAAALVHDGRTALALVDSTPVRPGEWVLVTAAAGGLGILLVQLAHAAGARVVGAARGPAKLETVEASGAEVTVDYSEPDWAARVVKATGGAGPALVYDGAGGELGRQAYEIVADGGRFSAHGNADGGFFSSDQEDAKRRGLTVRGIEQAQLPPEEGRRLTERSLVEAAAGRLSPVIGQVFPLEKAADAHAAIEARASVGKTLLKPA